MSAKRLTHSRSAYLRYMQMSRASIFALVEGKDIDPFFYGQICRIVCEPKGIRYELCKANELPPHAGGKTTLIEFYDYLRRERRLVSVLDGKKTTVVFFMDKDVDDLSRSRRRSTQVIYTRYYDVHNEVYRHGNLILGTACAASLEQTKLDPLLADSAKWCAHAARRWQDWLVLCLISVRNNVACQHNFRVPSQVQCPKTGNAGPTLLSQAQATTATRLRLSPTDFQRMYDTCTTRVNRYFRSGQHDVIFKGKWYPQLLDEDIRRHMGQVDYMRDGFTKRITACVSATLDFTDSWTDYYTSRLQAAVDRP